MRLNSSLTRHPWRDTDELKPEEYTKYVKEVQAAILEELRIWIAHHCFTRKPRADARNILDIRWVGNGNGLNPKTALPRRSASYVCG